MRLLMVFSMLLSSFCVADDFIYLSDIHIFESSPQKMRIIFELDSQLVTHNIFTLDSPQRLVVDLANTKLHGKKIPFPNQRSIIRAIRTAPYHKNDLRIVFDLTTSIRTQSFLLEPNEMNGHRLIIDIQILKSTSNNWWDLSGESNRTAVTSPIITATQQNITANSIIIAIDAGHGGIDSGATGINGTKEKYIVLSIAKNLATLVNKAPNMRAVLIRNGDYYIKLRKRIELAREYKANLFISIHADAFPDNHKVHGSSVYMLSKHGATSEMARWLAKKENAADLIGGISLNDKDELLAQVLLDLSISGTLETSAYLAKSVLKSLKKTLAVHTSQLQRANFIVLSSPDIPSILVETGFLSNPYEEQKLNLPKYRLQIAKAIFAGITEYIAQLN
ncbi:MAG: N-acetylmuramoyl-L-alanine amidase [Thiomargarita sp.]|nr:N-acetylmuramoyl-L-alanine amidase [Thiomargarita sp.]